MAIEAATLPSILLIAGNPADAVLIQELLKSLEFPHELTVAKDGQMALDLLVGAAASCCPDLIVLDRFLAKVHPRQVLDEIQAVERTRNIPLLLTGSEYDGRQNGMPPGQTYAGRLSSVEDYLGLCQTIKRLLAHS